jgi:hypothetical protein
VSSAEPRDLSRHRTLGLEELPVVLPPSFAEACGYRGDARYVGFCWIPEKLELRWSDDGHGDIGNANAFMAFCNDSATKAAMRSYSRANAREPLRPWLLVDQRRGKLSYGSRLEVWRIVDGQGRQSRR